MSVLPLFKKLLWHLLEIIIDFTAVFIIRVVGVEYSTFYLTPKNTGEEENSTPQAKL